MKVLAFARIREMLEASEQSLDLPGGARVADAWSMLVSAAPELDALGGSTRVARNGRVVSLDEPLCDGDELALLPPVGGG
ncbi:MAG TPA: MoaD/ThiS family protein [Candidatus Baltobacteraceae bacterium]|nr:MoaD/ThiS family protein [Candidatus Baltobacteraceae bacterium]